MKIYTRGNRPFVMGGKVHYFLGTDVEASEPFDVGRGVSCRLVVAPNGDTFCVEAETGAIVGATPGDVKSDMAETDDETVQQQLARARIDAASAEMVTPQKFWELMRRT